MYKLLSILAIIVPFAVSAQNYTFSEYQRDANDVDVHIDKPDGFNCLSDTSSEIRNPLTLDVNPEFRIPGCGHHYPTIGWIYSAIFESDNKDALLMYPGLFKYLAPLDHLIEQEIQASNSDHGLDVRPYLTTIAKEDMTQYANADTVIIYEFDIKGKPVLGKYNHCIGIYTRKYAHPSLGLKIVTDSIGPAKKDEYIKTMLKSVRYGNDVSAEGKKWEQDYPGAITILSQSPRPSSHQH